MRPSLGPAAFYYVRYLILSDIHANLDALEAVLEAAGKDGYDRILCCGDLVGYGADPNPVTEWVRDHVREIVRGNHDRACAGMEDLEWFNPAARQSALWTQANLTETNAAYLRALPKGPRPVANFQILHGSPLDEDEYLVQPMEASLVSGYLDTTLSFFGHTHLQGGFRFERRGVKGIPGVESKKKVHELALQPDLFYLINPGSVGQPRDGDPRAAWATYELEERLVTFRRVAYNVEKAQSKILAAGLPPVLARRLSLGQ